MIVSYKGTHFEMAHLKWLYLQAIPLGMAAISNKGGNIKQIERRITNCNADSSIMHSITSYDDTIS